MQLQANLKQTEYSPMETHNMYQICTKADFKKLIPHLIKDEDLYLQISSMLLHQNKFYFPKKEKHLIATLTTSTNQLISVALLGASQELYICSKKPIPIEAFAFLLQLQIKTYGNIATLFCRPTLQKDLFDLLMSYLKKKDLSYHCQKYYSMMIDSALFSSYKKKDNWFSISYNHKKYQKQLYELHAHYLQEEVYRHNPLSFSDAVAIAPSLLQNQLVAVAYHEQKLIGKVNTNLRGYQIVQLGGIYTKQEARKKGVASALLTSIGKRLSSYYNAISLFARQENRSAINLYQMVGFSIIGDLEIYYIDR